MAAGYSHRDFDVSFDDCKDLLDGIRIKGFVSDSRDELTYSFSLAAGRTDTAQVTTGYKSGHINNGYFVSGDSRNRDLMLKLETRLPDDAVLSDRELKFDSNGAACFRIGFGGDSAARAPMYIALSPKGELLAQGSGEAIALPDVERLWFNLYDDSSDAYFDGERLYTLDNISYTAGYDMSCGDSELLGLLNEYGGGFPGYIVSMTVMDRNGVVASGLRPLSIRVSGGRGSSQTVSVSFDMKR